MQGTLTKVGVAGRRLLALVVLLLGAAPALRADSEPWKSKPYQKWGQDDLDRVLTDSPWARKLLVRRSWLRSSAKDLPTDAKDISKGARRQGKTFAETNDALVGSEIYFTVSWGSSRAIRKAWARKALMQRQLSEQDADKIVAEAFDEFQIVVQSLDMTAFSERDEAYFKDKTSLQGRLSAEKVAPSGVRYKRDPKGAVQAVLFSFPKRTPSGEPVIGAREESVGLAIAFEEQTLRVSFDPRRMLDQDGKPDY